MRALLITHWYKPVKSPVKRMGRIAEYLSHKYQTTVVTSLPSYPTGVLPEKYRGKFYDIEQDGQIKIIRIWDYPTPNKGLIKRALSHVIFVFTSALTAFLMPPQDLVIVSSPSFFAGLSGVFASLLGRRKFIFDVRDLWPDSAFELGYKVNKPLRYLLKGLEKFFYLRAKKIFTATGEIRKTIIRMGIPASKVVTLVNTVDTDVFKPIKISRPALKLKKEDFIIVYVGSLTQVQNLKTAIEAANMVKKATKIKFLLIGEGEDKENLISQANFLGLNNIIFIDGQPTEKIIEYINASDLALISLSTNKFFSDNALPTKTSEYLGCGKPILACAGSNLQELIEQNNVGKVVKPGDSKALASATIELYKNPTKLKIMSKNARKLAIEQFSDKNFYQILDRSLKDL